jgi:Fic family protein
MTYNWQQTDWPDFRYDPGPGQDALLEFARRAGHIGGILKSLPEGPYMDSIVDMMVLEAIKTSEIEGEMLSRKDVWSSVRNNLGLNKTPERIRDKKAAGIAALMVAVRETYSDPLSEETLFSWHKMVMAGSAGINAGQWRTHLAPMQIVSGPIGRETVHFEAPPSERIPEEMKKFIRWFNETAPGEASEIKNPLIRSAISHVYFETIHPFEDGNGRIGRALAEKALSQGVGAPALFSLSKTIEAGRREYYEELNRAQRSNEISRWIGYFVRIVLDAQKQAEGQIEFTLAKTRFFDRFAGKFNPRQEKALRRMLEEGSGGFEGGMNARKYVSITQTSKATATRDLQELVALGVFEPVDKGRSARYILRI